MTIRNRNVWYGRFEWSETSGHDLAVPDNAIFDVSKLQGGYTRYLTAWRGLTPGFGGSLSAGIVPSTLRPVCGSRFNPSFSIYLTRPAPHQM